MAGSGTEVEWAAGYGLAVEDRRTALDLTASTYTEDGARPGTPQAQNSSALTVSTPGTTPPASGTTLELRTQQGGLVGGASPATMVWREESGDWHGHEEMPLSAVATVLEAKSGGTYLYTKDPNALTLPDGSVLVAFEAQHSALAPTYRVAATVFAIDATTSQATIFGQEVAPAGDGFRPTLCRLQSGRILCYSWWVDTGSETAQIRVDYSDDGGASWALGSEAVLPTPIDVSSIGYDTAHMSAADGDGGVLLVVQLVNAAASVSTYRDEGRHYASRDFGQSFTLISRTDEDSGTDSLTGCLHPEVVHTAKGTFAVCWISPADEYPYCQRLSNAFDHVFDGDPIAIANDFDRATFSTKLADDYTLSLCEDHGGALLINSQIPGSNRIQQIHRSDDDGKTWNGIGFGSVVLGGGAHWWNTGGTTLYVRDVALAAQSGRLVGFANFLSASTTLDASLIAIAIGGPSTWTLPPYQQSDLRDRQVTWDYIWGGFGIASSKASTTLTTSGSTTVTEGLRFSTITTSSSNGYYTDTFVPTSWDTDQGAIVEQTIGVVSGGNETTNVIQISLRVRDGTAHYFARIYLDSTGYGLYDNNGGQLATSSSALTSGALYDWRMAVTTGKVSCAYRLHTWAGTEPWTLIADGVTLAAGAGGSDEVLVYRGVVGTTAEIKLGKFGLVYGGYAGSQLTTTYSNPEMLHGRPWSPTGVPVGTDGVLVAARGVTIRGDEWHIESTSETPVANLLRGSPRRPWIASGTTQQTIVLDLQTGGDSSQMSDVMAVSGFDCNVRSFTIYGVPATGSDVTLATVDTSEGMANLEWVRSGDSITVDTSGAGASDDPTFTHSELTGAYFVDGGECFRISGNRPGKWTKLARNRPVLFLDPTTYDSGSSSTTGSAGKIVPKDWAVLIDMHGRQYEKIKIVIDAVSASIAEPPEGKWRIGRLHVGWVSAHHWQPSWGNRVTVMPNRQDIESRDVQRESTVLAPIRRKFRSGFVDGIRQYNVINVTHDEDGDWFEVSDHADAEGMGQVGMVLQTLEGILYETDSGRNPVVQLMYFTRFTTDAGGDVQLLNRRHELALTTMESEIAWDRVTGQTMYGELIRGDAIEYLEVV